MCSLTLGLNIDYLIDNKMAKSKIHIKKSKQGSLHRALGIPEGEKIPASKLKTKPGDSAAMKKKKTFAKNARKWKHPYGGEIEEYGIGGDILGGVATGSALGPWGALAGGAIGLVGGLLGNSKKNKEEEEMKQLERQKLIQNYATMQGAASNSMYTPTFPYGGMVNAEIEKEEVVVPPNGVEAGVRRKYNLPTHGNKTGENMISAQPGSFVLSDRLMYDDNRTFAQAYEEAGKKVDKYKKILDNPKSTSLATKTAQRNLTNIQKLQQSIINKNQAMLGEAQGGIPKAAFGLNVGNLAKGVGKFLKSDTFSIMASLAPVAYNLISGTSDVEKLNPREFENPYAASGVADMANRRYDAGPAYEANKDATATAMYNLNTAGAGSRGALNANRQALLNAQLRGNAGINAQAVNANNQYASELAQYKAGVGKQLSDTRTLISDLNARNEAAGRNFLGTAMGQLGQYGQTQQLMRNQEERDSQMMERWNSFFEMFQGSKQPVDKYKANFNQRVLPRANTSHLQLTGARNPNKLI